MTLPNFLIIGAQKAGTTWLAYMLNKHPEVFMPNYEIHFFDRVENFSQGIEWYEAKFVLADSNKKAIGEKTPEYLWVNGDRPAIHQTVKQFFPNIKLIIVLRNPVERAISHANHLVRYGYLSPFDNIDRIIWNHVIIDKGKYYQQIKEYYRVFDPEQIFTLINEEDIIQRPQQSLQKICDFLDIDSTFKFENEAQKIHNHSSTKSGLILGHHLPALRPLINRIDKYLPGQKFKSRPSESTVEKLYEFYAEENKKLFDFLERKPFSWLSQSNMSG